jgi:hypothetical protein
MELQSKKKRGLALASGARNGKEGSKWRRPALAHIVLPGRSSDVTSRMVLVRRVTSALALLRSGVVRKARPRPRPQLSQVLRFQMQELSRGLLTAGLQLGIVAAAAPCHLTPASANKTVRSPMRFYAGEEVLAWRAPTKFSVWSFGLQYMTKE